MFSLLPNPLVSSLTFHAFQNAGFEKRGEIIRLVQTLRGGYKPKGSEADFPEVSVMPRSCWEPWGIFREPFEGTVAQKSASLGYRGVATPSERRAIERCGGLFADARLGEGDRPASFPEAPTLPSADRPSVSPLGRWDHLRPVRGQWLDVGCAQGLSGTAQSGPIAIRNLSKWVAKRSTRWWRCPPTNDCPRPAVRRQTATGWAARPEVLCLFRRRRSESFPAAD